MDPKELDRHAGEVMRRLRTEKGWSQQELADAMTAAGVPTHPLTVLKIEKGTRPMRLAEVRVMLDLLGGDWSELDPPTSLEDFFYEAEDMLGEESHLLRESLLRFMKTWTVIKESVEALEPYVEDVRVRGLHSFQDFTAGDNDCIAAIAREVAAAEDEWRRNRLSSKEDAEKWIEALMERKAAVEAELKRDRSGEGSDGEHPEAPER